MRNKWRQWLSLMVSVIVLFGTCSYSGLALDQSDVAREMHTFEKKNQQWLTQPASSQFKIVKKSVDAYGNEHTIYQQLINGIPVYGAYTRNPEQYAAQSAQKLPSARMNPFASTLMARMSGGEAVERLIEQLENELGEKIDRVGTIAGLPSFASSTELMIYPYENRNYLAYEVKVSYIKPVLGSWVAYVDATTGDVIDRYSKLSHLSREYAAVGSGQGHHRLHHQVSVYQDVYGELDPDYAGYYYLIDITKSSFQEPDSGFIETLSVAVDESQWLVDSVRSETAEFIHPEALDAHVNTGEVFDLYQQRFGLNSFDNQGATIVSIVNHPDAQMVNNAAWISGPGMGYFAYGNATGMSNGGMDCIACSRDIVVHEYAHAIIEHSAQLEYRNQSGALNESIADIMAAVLDEDGDEWLIGEETGRPIRSMVDPTQYGQPAHMSDYVLLDPSEDNGGVHYNSGILNKAAYLIATKVDGLQIPGLDGRAFLGQLTYDVLFNYLTPTSDFYDARDAYIEAAAAYAADPEAGLDAQAQADIIQSVKDAWQAVGLAPDSYENVNIKSVEVAESVSGVLPIIDDRNQVVYFFVPYGTDVTSITPIITVSAQADYEPKTALNFHNEQRAAAIHVFNRNDQTRTAVWTLVAVEEPILHYAATTFQESDANDGSIANHIDIRLVNDEFTGNAGEEFIAQGKAAVYHVPDGLTPSIVKINNQTLRFSLKGKARAHAAANDSNMLRVEFADSAFTRFYLAQVTNRTTTFSVNFNDPVNHAGGSGGGGFIFFPPIPEVQQGDDDTAIKPDVTPQRLDNGLIKLEVSVPESDLNRAIDAWQKGTDNQPVITISATGTGDLVSFSLPAASLVKARAAHANGKILVETDTVSYELPVALLDIEALSEQLGAASRELNVIVSMNRVTGEIAQQIRSVGSRSQMQIVGDPIDFDIQVASGSQSISVTDFGKKAVTRSITVPGTLSPGEATVLLYNPENQRFSFVPASFEALGGKTKVSFKRNGNSIYVIAKLKRIFADTAGHWAKADIELLASKAIISGMSANAFNPNADITRAEFASILTKALGLRESAAVTGFADVSGSEWFASAVAAGVEAGLINGFADGTFRPNAPITRAEMAVMLAGALTYSGHQPISRDQAEHALTVYKDDEVIGGWARQAAGAVVHAGIISGFTADTFAPAELATRAQAAVMVRRMMTVLNLI